jgi:hypothetical protein
MKASVALEAIPWFALLSQQPWPQVFFRICLRMFDKRQTPQDHISIFPAT